MNLDYKVKYSNRRTLGITVDRDKSVIVHAPNGTSSDRISNAVESKKLWIFKKLKSEQKYSDKIVSKEFVSGESILYLGRNYRLEVSERTFTGIQFNNKFVISSNSKKQASNLIRVWLKQKAEEKIPPKVKYFAKSLGVNYKEINISELKYRWGSCSPKGNLNFNLKLIKAPMYVIEYIVVHELAHLLESNHSAKFWNIVSVQIPHYAKAKKWLLDHGSLLDEELC